MDRKANDMAQENFADLGPIYSEIGEEAAAIVGADADGIYLYVEVGDEWMSPNLYREDADAVRWFDASRELTGLVWDAWGAEEANRRWCVMEYEARAAKFDARFRFPDEVNVESMDEDRREVALKRRFGDKPIVYPPPDGWAELK